MSTRWQPPGRTERPHPLTPLVQGWLVLVAIAVAVVPQLAQTGARLDLRWIAVIVVAVALLAALMSYFSWRFTRFVIDSREVRIETGWLNTSSKKVAFERVQSIDIVQPLVARIFGLAQLTIEAGGSDSNLQLRFLTRNRAHQLRDYLLARAHDRHAEPDAVTASAPAVSAFTGVSEADEVLVRLTPKALIVGFLTSSDFLVTMAIALLVLAGFGVGLVVEGPAVLLGALPVLLATGVGLINLVAKYVVSQLNYTMVRARSGNHHGVRVTSGLTSLTSRTIPMDRVQGFKIHQGLIWRWLGLYRVEVDVIGASRPGAENEGPGNVLLPIGTGEQVATSLGVLLPGQDLHPQLVTAPRRSRWVRPLDFWTLRHGVTADVIVDQHGWWHRVQYIVPHAKTQSVRITRGPLQRALGLGTVHVDNVDGPVNVAVKHLDPERARALAMSQLDRARAARS